MISGKLSSFGISSLRSTWDAARKASASRASQPTVSDVGARGIIPSRSTRPCVERMPYRSQKLAGTLVEPAVSVESPMSHAPAATAEAAPDEEPPGTCPGVAGLAGVPSNAFSPNRPSEISSVTVFPTRLLQRQAGAAQPWHCALRARRRLPNQDYLHRSHGRRHQINPLR